MAPNALSNLSGTPGGYRTLNRLARRYGTGAPVVGSAASAAGASPREEAQQASQGFLAENADLFKVGAQGLGFASKMYDAATAGPGFGSFTSSALDTLGGAGTAAQLAASTGMGAVAPGQAAALSGPLAGSQVLGGSTAVGGAQAGQALSTGASAASGGASTAAAAPFALNPATIWLAPAIGGLIAGFTSKQPATAELEYDEDTGYSQGWFNRGDYGNELQSALPGFLSEVNAMGPQRGGDATVTVNANGPQLTFDRDLSAHRAMKQTIAHDDHRFPREGQQYRSLNAQNLLAGPMTPEGIMQRQAYDPKGDQTWAPTYQDILDQRKRK